MSSNQQFTLEVPNIFDRAAPTDTPDGDAASVPSYAQLGLPFDGMWYSPQPQLPWGDGSSWDGTSPYTPLQNQLLDVSPIQYPHRLDCGSTGSPSHGYSSLPISSIQRSALNVYERLDDTPPIDHLVYNMYGPSHLPSPGDGDYFDAGNIDVSPSYDNTLPHMNPIQWPASITYGHPYKALPALDQDRYHASDTLSKQNLYPDLPPDKGMVSGMSDAVVGADDSSARPVHSHRRGGKKGEVASGPVNDCTYDGKEEPLKRDKSGYAKPMAIYECLPKLKTEAIDYLVLHEDEAHGVASDGGYICRAQGSIVRGMWQTDKEVCGRVLRNKDGYRRHFEEQHLGLRRMINGKHAPIEDRIRRAQEEVKQRLKAERESRPTKKRKRVSDEGEFERDEQSQSKRRRDTAHR